MLWTHFVVILKNEEVVRAISPDRPAPYSSHGLHSPPPWLSLGPPRYLHPCIQYGGHGLFAWFFLFPSGVPDPGGSRGSLPGPFSFPLPGKPGSESWCQTHSYNAPLTLRSAFCSHSLQLFVLRGSSLLGRDHCPGGASPPGPPPPGPPPPGTAATVIK